MRCHEYFLRRLSDRIGTKISHTDRGTKNTEPSEVPVVGVLTTCCNTKEFCVVPHELFRVILTVHTNVSLKHPLPTGDWRLETDCIVCEAGTGKVVSARLEEYGGVRSIAAVIINFGIR